MFGFKKKQRTVKPLLNMPTAKSILIMPAVKKPAPRSLTEIMNDATNELKRRQEHQDKVAGDLNIEIVYLQLQESNAGAEAKGCAKAIANFEKIFGA
ncbi:MAG: hypothetical protein HRT61_00675 [Ekhidna sp.]|nr:hypothetical protein [Ekhidna sp.]